MSETLEHEEPGLALEFAPVGKNGSVMITARIGDDVLAVEKLDLSKSKAREAFAAKLCDGRPGIDPTAIEAELLKQAARLTEVKPPSSESANPAAEIDVSAIVRPERIIRPEVSGVAVPIMAAEQTKDGVKVRGRWSVYLQWADGRREQRPLDSTLDMPGDGGCLYVHPTPGPPTPTTPQGWTAGSRLKWLEGETAPNPAEVFKRICKAIAYYLDLPAKSASGTTATLALWVILTYSYYTWSAIPYLYLGGPAGSGKSRVFEILSRLCFRPLATSNLTAASLFRSLDAFGGTLILDEAERLKRSTDPDVAEILSMLLAGYKAGGSALRLEPIGDSGFKTVAFDVFGPKALACIAGLPPALAARSIAIVMFRSAPGSDKPRRRIDSHPARWAALRDDLHTLTLEHGPTFIKLADKPDVCPAMSGRDFELWQPLLALAFWIEESGAEGLLALMQQHALDVIQSGKEEQVPDQDETLLKLLGLAVARDERPTPGEVLEAARETDPEGFKRWSPRGVAEHLRRYGLRTMKTHGAKRYAHVTTGDLARVQDNYGFDLGITTE